MADKKYNKIILGNETLLDLSLDDVSASDVASGKKFHLPDGSESVGTNTYDADTSDADAIAGDIIATKTAYVNGTKLTGTMTNNGGVSGTISSLATPYTVPSGYHDGTGKVTVDTTESAKIIPGNIKSGIEILGVTGTYGGETVKAQSKTVKSLLTEQTVLPDTGFDYLSQVTVKAISKVETPNSAGGITVTIGDIS